MFAGAALYGLPILLFASTDLSPVPFDAGLFLLVNTAVNLHHFVLDGAIWKLRDSAVGRILLRSVEQPTRPSVTRRGAHWRRIAIVMVASVYLLQSAVNTFEREFGVMRARDDVQRLRVAERRLTQIRLPSPQVSTLLGLALANADQLVEAEIALEKSIDRFPSVLTWTALGQVRSRQRDWPGAEQALTEALALEPDQRTALHELGRVRLASGDAAGAIAPLEQALMLSDGEDHRNLSRLLKQALRAAQLHP
jgi:tetratricopeptide (TPR) repeat protein